MDIPKNVHGPAPLPDNQGPNNINQAGNIPPKQQDASKPPIAQPNVQQTPPSPPSPPPSMPQQSQPGQPLAGASVPPPPKKQIDVRTMASDAQSLKSSGGFGAEPKTFTPNDFGKGPAYQPKKDIPKIKGQTNPKKHILFIGIGVVVVLVAAAAVAYFFILPIFSQKTPVVPPPPVPTEEKAVTEQAATTTTEQATTTEAVQSFVHQTFFKGAPEFVKQVPLSKLSVGDLSSALESAIDSSSTKDSITEVAFTVDEKPLSAQELLSTVLPPESINSIFTEDFTAYAYYDGSNVWPGYVFLLNDGEDKAAAEKTVAEWIEKNTNLENLYINAPGARDKDGFRDGSVGAIATRYLPFAEKGASLNYGWLNNYLIIGTSFNGFQSGVNLLKSTGG